MTEKNVNDECKISYKEVKKYDAILKLDVYNSSGYQKTIRDLKL